MKNVALCWSRFGSGSCAVSRAVRSSRACGCQACAASAQSSTWIRASSGGPTETSQRTRRGSGPVGRVHRRPRTTPVAPRESLVGMARRDRRGRRAMRNPGAPRGRGSQRGGGVTRCQRGRRRWRSRSGRRTRPRAGGRLRDQRERGLARRHWSRGAIAARGATRALPVNHSGRGRVGAPTWRANDVHRAERGTAVPAHGDRDRTRWPLARRHVRDGTQKGPARNSAGPRSVRNLSTRAARVSLGIKTNGSAASPQPGRRVTATLARLTSTPRLHADWALP